MNFFFSQNIKPHLIDGSTPNFQTIRKILTEKQKVFVPLKKNVFSNTNNYFISFQGEHFLLQLKAILLMKIIDYILICVFLYCM